MQAVEACTYTLVELAETQILTTIQPSQLWDQEQTQSQHSFCADRTNLHTTNTADFQNVCRIVNTKHHEMLTFFVKTTISKFLA